MDDERKIRRLTSGVNFPLDETRFYAVSFFVHILELANPVQLGPLDVIQPGEYLVEDLNGAQLMTMAGGGRMNTFLTRDRIDPKADYNGKAILLVRVGGFGDLVLMTPLMRAIKERWPDCELHVCALPHYLQVLQNLPFVDALVPYPLETKTVNDYAEVIFFENAVEHNPAAKDRHISELFAMIAGMPPIEKLLPSYAVKATEGIWVNEMFPRVAGVMRACIQVGASAICRVYPRNQLGDVVKALLNKKWEVFLLGAKGEIQLPEGGPRTLHNLADMNLSFRQSCAVLNTADVVIGSDSAMVHVAGALGVPAVGLYGPFPWKLRTAHCPTTFAIQGKGDCSPCFHHANPVKRNHFPDNCPSKAQGYCQVLAEITPARIVARAESIARHQPEKLADVIQINGNETP